MKSSFCKSGGGGKSMAYYKVQQQLEAQIANYDIVNFLLQLNKIQMQHLENP